MNIYKRIYDEANKKANLRNDDIRKVFYRILEEEHLITDNNKEILYSSFGDTLDNMLSEKRENLKEAYPILPRDKKSKNYKQAKKILDMFYRINLLNNIYDLNQKDIKKYGDKINIEALFRNGREPIYNDEEDKLLTNEKIKFGLLSIFEEMLSYENGAFYVKLLRDRYATLEYTSKEDIAKRNYLSVKSFEYKLIQAINFFGDIFEEMFSYNTIDTI